MPEIVADSESNIGLEHPSFKKVEAQITKPQEVVFSAPSPDLARDVLSAMEIFPANVRPTHLSEKVPTFHAAVFSPKTAEATAEQGEPKPKVGLFFLSGVPGSGAGHGFIAAEMFQAAKDSKLGDVSIAGAIGSVLSTDVEGSRFVSNSVERSAYLAAFFEELLAKKDVDDIYLMGHSFGAAEIMYMAPLLNKLFEIRGQKTRVKGAILHQPGAMLDQRDQLLSFATTRTGQVASFVDEAKMMFPTKHDFGDMEVKIGQAQDKGDQTLARSLQAILDEMREQPGRNQHYIDESLNEAEKSKLAKIEHDLEIADSKGDTKNADRLYSERLKILAPMVIKNVNKREKNPKDPGGLFFANLLPLITTKEGLLGLTPPEIRKLVDFPIAVSSSDTDIYFPEDKIRLQRDLEQARQFEEARVGKIKDTVEGDSEGKTQNLRINEKAFNESRMFPRAPITFEVDIPNLPHSGTTVDPERVAPMAIDMFTRMKEAMDNHKQGIVRLQYSGKLANK